MKAPLKVPGKPEPIPERLKVPYVPPAPEPQPPAHVLAAMVRLGLQRD